LATEFDEQVMTISFEIPPEIEQQIRTDGVDLDRDAKEVYLEVSDPDLLEVPGSKWCLERIATNECEVPAAAIRVLSRAPSSTLTCLRVK
jgi:hypothetical protein